MFTKFIQQQERKGLLRFLTCGSVDDGKSTLIGRLLHDCHKIYQDQLAEIEQVSKNRADDKTDLSLLMDGLQAEREQGITIDVAYRYFSTDKRKFIIADTPGHEQYTRNMATGASRCDLAIVIVDAQKGIQKQTKRHTFICHLLGIRHIIVAVNKMDLIHYKDHIFQQVKNDYRKFSSTLDFQSIRFVPLSAMLGDNVVHPSKSMDWYPGATLLKLLETVKIQRDLNTTDLRFPVQYVNRPDANFRGYCGTLASGCLSINDKVRVLPSGKTSTINSILQNGQPITRAYPEMAITLTLQDELDISRGDMIVSDGEAVTIGQQFQANLIWFNDLPLKLQKRYLLKLATQTVPVTVLKLLSKTDIHTLETSTRCHSQLFLNEICLALFESDEPIVIDSFKELPHTGSFVLIDPYSYATVGAGMLLKAQPESSEKKHYSKAELELNRYIREHYPEWGCKKISEPQ